MTDELNLQCGGVVADLGEAMMLCHSQGKEKGISTHSIMERELAKLAYIVIHFIHPERILIPAKADICHFRIMSWWCHILNVRNQLKGYVLTSDPYEDVYGSSDGGSALSAKDVACPLVRVVVGPQSQVNLVDLNISEKLGHKLKGLVIPHRRRCKRARESKLTLRSGSMCFLNSLATFWWSPTVLATYIGLWGQIKDGDSYAAAL